MGDLQNLAGVFGGGAHHDRLLVGPLGQVTGGAGHLLGGRRHLLGGCGDLLGHGGGVVGMLPNASDQALQPGDHAHDRCGEHVQPLPVGPVRGGEVSVGNPGGHDSHFAGGLEYPGKQQPDQHLLDDPAQHQQCRGPPHHGVCGIQGAFDGRGHQEHGRRGHGHGCRGAEADQVQLGDELVSVRCHDLEYR
jgi:hypothetical protein